jgi:hypothetical protein
MRQSKLKDLKNNMLIDRVSAEDSIKTDSDTVSQVIDNTSEVNNSANEETSSSFSKNKVIPEEDMYTPKTSSWGVFKRPRDISKAYGGGRVYTPADMKKMSIENEREKALQVNKKVYINEEMQWEDENKEKIKDALSRSRGLMGIGDTYGAVALLEGVKVR